MRKKKKILIIIAVVLLILGLFFIFLTSKEETVKTPEDKTQAGTGAETKIEVEDEPEILENEISLQEQEESEKMTLNLRARNFIERAGSFSSDSEDLNLREMESIMSSTLFEKLQTDLAKELAENEGVFYGKTTKVVNLDMTEFGPDTRAHFKATIQAQTTKGRETSADYQTVEITFLKETGQWKAVEMAIY